MTTRIDEIIADLLHIPTIAARNSWPEWLSNHHMEEIIASLYDEDLANLAEEINEMDRYEDPAVALAQDAIAREQARR
jgi:hypothetical protein